MEKYVVNYDSFLAFFSPSTYLYTPIGRRKRRLHLNATAPSAENPVQFISEIFFIPIDGETKSALKVVIGVIAEHTPCLADIGV